MKTVSVIIPVYNVVAYLERCLESVRLQAYQQLQVILVNDGSTDNSPAIAQQFVDKDHRFQLIHRKNGGLSAARNTGLDYVEGEFVFFLDSDDYLEKDCIETLVKVSNELDTDITQANFYYDYPNYLLYAQWQDKPYVRLSSYEVLNLLLEQKMIKNFAWGKLIHSDLAKKHLFPEGKYFEDTLWMIKLVDDCDSYGVVAAPLLYYLQRDSGISGAFSLRNLDQLELSAGKLDFLLEKYDENLYYKALKQFNDLVLSHQRLLPRLSLQDQVIYKKALQDYIYRFELNRKFSFLHTVANNNVLNLLSVNWNRLKGRFLNKDKWIRVKKH